MAGFRLNEEYHVPRTHIALPHCIDFYMRLLFPNVVRWRAEVQSGFGDKSTCAKNFIYDLLPWLTQVLVQNGIYFIMDYPEHELSRLLKTRIPGYERWAHRQRRWVRELVGNREVKRVDQLNVATRGAFESLSSRVDSCVRHQEAANQKMDQRRN